MPARQVNPMNGNNHGFQANHPSDSVTNDGYTVSKTGKIEVRPRPVIGGGGSATIATATGKNRAQRRNQKPDTHKSPPFSTKTGNIAPMQRIHFSERTVLSYRFGFDQIVCFIQVSVKRSGSGTMSGACSITRFSNPGYAVQRKQGNASPSLCAPAGIRPVLSSL